MDVLVHESCHLDQFIGKSKLWNSSNDPVHVVEAWIKGKKVSLNKRDEAFNNALLLELDCEKRSIKKIKKYKLNIDTEQYAQKANSYLFAYLVALHEKRWYTSPYENPKIWKEMPTKLLTLKNYIDGYRKYKHLYK